MSNHKTGITFFLFFCCLQITFAQTDTLISHDIETGLNHIYPPIIIDTTKTFDNTAWNYGTEAGFDSLNLTPPTNTYNNSGFTDFVPAHNFFPVNDYPARIAAKIFVIRNDSLKQECSGILVAKNYVLTACHCIGEYDTNYVFHFFDSLAVYPGFDNGKENQFFGKSPAVEYFTFKSNLVGSWKQDMALIKLKDDLGTKAGWVGIAFSKDDLYFKNRVFHKFSYPGFVDPSDSTRIFNGDTLYYNYGTLDLIDPKWLGYNINAIPGQSGSSMLYTNNKEYYSFGVSIYASSSRNFRISPEIFYAFKSIISSGISVIKNDKELIKSYYLSEAYPNPFNPSTHITYEIPVAGLVQLKVYDILGKEVKTLVNEIKTKGKYNISFYAGGLSSGIYFYRIQAGSFVSTKKLILLK
jgi:V8-like Glu-specific endopeptidase